MQKYNAYVQSIAHSSNVPYLSDKIFIYSCTRNTVITKDCTCNYRRGPRGVAPPFAHPGVSRLYWYLGNH